MSGSKGPSNTDLVYEVLQGSPEPMTLDEILDKVNRKQAIRTRNPRNTVRGVLNQGWQLVKTGQSTWGCLPRLVTGCLLRLPIVPQDIGSAWLAYTDEARDAFWPSFFENQKRKSHRPVTVHLPNGERAELALEHRTTEDLFSSSWGSQLSDSIIAYLTENQVDEGDSLLVRIVDGQQGITKAWVEHCQDRDESAISHRNEEIADGVETIIRGYREYQMPIWHVTTRLFGTDLYSADVAPDPLTQVLSNDDRFFDIGLGMWMLTEDVDELVVADVEMRKRALDLMFNQTPGTIEIEVEFSDSTEATVGGSFTNPQSGAIFFDQMVLTDNSSTSNISDQLFQAQDMMYVAWQTTDPQERVRLAHEALAISPDCADAYVLLSRETARSSEEAIELLQRGVAAGELAIGKESFTADAGYFWGILETRPYMRARFALADELWNIGRQHEAIEHARDMLRLNPGDNQGIRYILIGWLLTIGNDPAVSQLLGEYPEDGASEWLYAKALHTFRVHGDDQQARDALGAAILGNPHVPGYLVGTKTIPDVMPAMVTLGGEDEAIHCADLQLGAWDRTEGALRWLEGHAL